MGATVEPATKVIQENIQNIDIAPTILDIAGLSTPKQFDGQSFLPLLEGNDALWRDTIYYEYFWERPYPQTPTVHAIRTADYKYIRYHGIWDLNELYNINQDPLEMNNLIRNPDYAKEAQSLRTALFHWLKESEGNQMYIRPDGKGARFDEGQGISYKKTY
jgi:arylsulfatase A-like enzyme